MELKPSRERALAAYQAMKENRSGRRSSVVLERQGLLSASRCWTDPFAGMAVFAGLGFESALSGFLLYSLAISLFLRQLVGVALTKTPSSDSVWLVLILSNGLVIASVLPPGCRRQPSR